MVCRIAWVFRSQELRTVCSLFAVVLALTGCSGAGPTGGDPGARPLPPGMTCQSLKSELDRMVSRGVQSSIEGQAAGRKLSANQKADADAYNAKLNQYLGARCHA